MARLRQRTIARSHPCRHYILVYIFTIYHAESYLRFFAQHLAIPIPPPPVATSTLLVASLIIDDRFYHLLAPTRSALHRFYLCFCPHSPSSRTLATTTCILSSPWPSSHPRLERIIKSLVPISNCPRMYQSYFSLVLVIAPWLYHIISGDSS